jgi:hypothetical protein
MCEIIIPYKEWYEGISITKGIPVSCPYASNDNCRRYWLTKYELKIIDQNCHESKRVEEFWNKSLNSIFALPFVEYKGPERLRLCSNLCPEAASEFFYGLYVEGICFVKKPKGETNILVLIGDHNLKWHNTPEDDPDYKKFLKFLKTVTSWGALHYSECPVYSDLSQKRDNETSERYEIPKAINNLKNDRQDIPNNSSSSVPTPKNKLRPNQESKIEVTHKAKALWEINPDFTIKEMTKHPHITSLGSSYTERTLREWVKEVAPKEKTKPGRPRQKTH